MQRFHYIKLIKQAFAVHPVVGLLGPRQCGKTTLAKQYINQVVPTLAKTNYFDLENPSDKKRLENPMLSLSELEGLIVIDEVQYITDLFPILRVLVDDESKQRQFLILGSASRDLIQHSSETLAGRIEYIELTPFMFCEIEDLEALWLRGGFPKSYLAKTEAQSVRWRSAYIRTFLERDIPALGIQIPAEHLRRFWMMLTHYHGNLFNASELGKSLSISHNTAARYLDILTGALMVRELTPWFENISKRQVKSPKIYFRDSGLLHTLLNIRNKEELLIHPKLGASWEGLALEEIIRHHQVESEECFFWSTHGEAELDLLLFRGGKRIGLEFKYTDAPKLTRPMQIAYEDLQLDQLFVIYPGDTSYPLTETIRVMGLAEYLQTVVL